MPQDLIMHEDLIMSCPCNALCLLPFILTLLILRNAFPLTSTLIVALQPVPVIRSNLAAESLHRLFFANPLVLLCFIYASRWTSFGQIWDCVFTWGNLGRFSLLFWSVWPGCCRNLTRFPFFNDPSSFLTFSLLVVCFVYGIDYDFKGKHSSFHFSRDF